MRFGVITSVAAHGDLVAVSVTDGGSKTEHGWVLIYRFPFGTEPPQELPVGVGPDMLTFSPLGNKLLVANEGEPECRVEGASHILVDPEGSISVIDLDHGIAYPAGTVDFAAQNGHEEELIDEGVRIYGPGATAAQDLEPEHIAVGPFGMRAWVTLQENNAIAVLDLFHNPPRVTDIVALGDKDHGRPENTLDVKDDGVADRRMHPNVFGMYQPDGIEAGIIDGRTYLFTANEGDARDYRPCFTEEDRVSASNLNLATFHGNEPSALLKLRVTNTRGKLGGAYDELYTFGGRSFAIWDTSGELIYDSGSMIEDLLAEMPDYFYDGRSDDKGPEPEDLAFGRVDGRPYLFVGLERANGVMAFDVSEPESPSLAAFLGNPPGAGFDAEGEFPERLDFVPAPSPVEKALLLVTNEASGNTRAFELSAKQ